MAVEKYLRVYAEPESRQLAAPHRRWQRVLVIPAHRESAVLLDRLDSLIATNSDTLVLLVVNRPDTATEHEKLPTAIQQRYPRADRNAIGSWHEMARNSTLLLVDRYSGGHTIPPKQGVGLARKIGCDIACSLIHHGAVTCPWIFSSDADVSWPEDYFAGANTAHRDNSALIYPFYHRSEPGLDTTPIQLYEFSLHYYVAGLHWAGSPYAHHSIGSTLAINHQHYARVRGFPRRSGGEDFYILNKLAKTGPLKKLRAPTLAITDRDSDRVPFGTGPARQRIAELSRPLEEYPLYHPGCFRELRDCLALFKRLATTQDPASDWRASLINVDGNSIAGPVALQKMGIEQAIDHAHTHSSEPEGFSRHIDNWFDAFRTLKLIHQLRDTCYPSLPFNDLIKERGFLQPLLPTQDNAANPAINLEACNRILRCHISG